MKYTIERIREVAFGLAQHSESAQMIVQLLGELHTLERDQRGWEDETRLFKEQRDNYYNTLSNLVNQIRVSNAVDDHGHLLIMNRAYCEAERLLEWGSITLCSVEEKP